MLGRHRLVGNRQARIVDLIQMVDHVDGREHVVAIGRAAAPLQVVDEAAEAARADGKIGMHLIFDRPKPHVRKSHRHPLGPIRALVILPHPGDHLPAELAGDLDQARIVAPAAAEPLEIAQSPRPNRS